VQWIQGLSAIEDSGALLADDMGLGKTIQTLCAIRFPALIIVPTSLLPQWEEEIGKFYPGINLCVYHGSGRVWSDDSDVTLSTYGLLRNDTGCFQSRNFSMTVLDEVQTIKNPESGVSEAAFSLCSDFRLALTGTPVENSLRDLWSIFNYILPGILPEPEALDALAMKEGGIELIRKLIHPFIKRRRKEDVLTELPEKTEITIPCVMDTMQRESYEKILFEAKSEAKDYLDKKKGFMSLFEKLLRLRQVCVHPSLSGLDSNIPSVKLEVLMDLLDQACKGGHKVLLFSQWTSALDIIEPLITKEISRPLRLDGSTRNRAPIIEQFKTDPSSQIFLLSLKAGGVGLNLTEADHVYFLDSWWNPAVEKQAADRVYRMGQDKPVFIYRLVVKDTIEEKILALHERKSALSNSLLEGSLDQSGRVTEEDIRFLLSL
jgi:SNF2 family DNA or RNA helicase